MPVRIYESFPQEIFSDQAVLYHGTSNLFEERIDAGGLIPAPNEHVVQVMQALECIRTEVLQSQIYTAPSGSWEILPFFTGELDKHGTRPVSLSLHFDRCKLFASADFAAGEAVRTIGRIRPHLLQLLNDQAIRDARMEKIRQAHTRLHPAAVHLYANELMLDLDELRRRVDAIDHLMVDLIKQREAYRYGVVYAVRLDGIVPDERLGAEAVGLYSFDPIPAHAILGKVILHDLELDGGPIDRPDDLLDRLLYWRQRVPKHTAQ